jgi:hypothetical protein
MERGLGRREDKDERERRRKEKDGERVGKKGG